MAEIGLEVTWLPIGSTTTGELASNRIEFSIDSIL
jgi:hypothetical protein